MPGHDVDGHGHGLQRFLRQNIQDAGVFALADDQPRVGGPSVNEQAGGAILHFDAHFMSEVIRTVDPDVEAALGSPLQDQVFRFDQRPDGRGRDQGDQVQPTVRVHRRVDSLPASDSGAPLDLELVTGWRRRR